MEQNKIALITGATAGIGKACAEIFAQNKYNLVLTGRRKERLTNLKKELEENYKINVILLNFDIRDYAQVEQQYNSLPENYKKIDVLINNAGLAMGLSSINNGDINDWDIMIDTNIKGLLYTTKIISNWMIANGKGHIINIGSIAGKEAYPNGNVYCATKHAVDALSRATRIDLLPHGIKVTNIAPGLVETEFSLVRFKGDAARAKQSYTGITPLYAKDIAEVIYFATSRPDNVNLNDIVITPKAQAMTRDMIRI